MSWLNLFSPRPSSEIVESPRRAVVALGGGGARGLAHLGAMQAIGESGVQIERIVGVSMGSLVGAMCALDPDIQQVQARALQLLHSPIFQSKQKHLCGVAPPDDDEHSGSTFSWYSRLKKVLDAHRRITKAVRGSSLISDAPLRESIEHLLPDVDIADVPNPLSIVAVDLLSGGRVVLESGSLRKAVLASTAIPGIFPPVPWDDMLLCDIGVIESIPTVIAQSYASDLTIAVDVGQDPMRIQRCDTALDVMMRLDDICERMMRRHVIEVADIVIRPEVGNIAWFDFSSSETVIELGRSAAKRTLNDYLYRRVA
ncbi:patatin-like phospholipase family protein [Neorhodopirellula pilleata]|uniref:NTE family protein RssA n=1 Tax=Neorhodopirellula pilleata TaxID=2714738 RepID=A0A5C5ZPQ9_9BACT|nr:patatin-like phospholipase family protein [Neorhodopirellula pilleata]TWT89210.1 NTE family protein RssA [Neorhodopirellula pilleata]